MQKSGIHFVFRHHFVFCQRSLSQPPWNTLVILQDIRPAGTYLTASRREILVAAQQSFEGWCLPARDLTMLRPANNRFRQSPFSPDGGFYLVSSSNRGQFSSSTSQLDNFFFVLI